MRLFNRLSDSAQEYRCVPSFGSFSNVVACNVDAMLDPKGSILVSKWVIALVSFADQVDQARDLEAAYSLSEQEIE